MFKKIVLENGLRIVLAPSRQSKTVTILVLVEAGSKYETKDKNGISHFLEHMMFKGTKKRPTPLAIATELDRIGGESNAFTSHEYTGYWAKVDSSHIDLALDIISDIYLHPLFDEKEIEKEKGVVIEEMHMYFDMPQRHVWDLWMELLYGDQPAGWPIVGKEETIRNLTRQDIKDYVSKYYLSSRTVITLSGNFGEDVLDKITNYFEDIPIGEGIQKLKVKEAQDSPKIKLFTKNTDQTHLVLGFRAFSLFDERRYALSVLSTILGGGMSSRLFQRLREELGMAYYVGASADLFTDHGFFAAYAGVDNKRIKLAISALVEEFQKIKKLPPSEDELSKAKDHICGSLLLNLETTDQLASYFGSQEILRKDIRTPEEHIKRIKKVNIEDVYKLANELFVPQHFNLSIIGPHKSEEELLELLSI
jgi:predicted Zn-dependent peptidase